MKAVNNSNKAYNGQKMFSINEINKSFTKTKVYGKDICLVL